MKSLKFSVLFALLPLTMAHAQENLGELKIDKFFLEPTFASELGTYQPGFSIGRSFLGASWTLDQAISAHIMLGPKFMIRRPARYLPTVSQDLGVVEGFGELDTGLGILRAGLIPIPFAMNGLKNEAQEAFPDDLFAQSAFIQRRDYGASYFITYNDFTTAIAGHNGESGPDEDGRYWMTGRWSVLGPAKTEFGVSGSTGHWIDTGTLKEQKIRAGNLFASLHLYGLGLAIEGSMVSMFNNDVFVRQAYGWHVDLEHPLFWDNVGLQLRYDFLEPHHAILNDQTREISYGINYHSHYWNSVFYVLGNTRFEEGSSLTHHSAMVIWKLTPLVQ